MKTHCPSCSKEFEVPESYIGRKATCAACKSKFVVEAIAAPAYELVPSWESELPTAEAVETVQYTPPPIKIKPAPAPMPKRSNFLMKQVPIWIVGASSVGALTLGCVAGREHLKYQVRSQFEQAFLQFGGTREALNAGKSGKANSPEPKAAIATPPKQQFMIGDVFSNEKFSVAVLEARVGVPKLADKIGDLKYNASKDYLMLTLQFANKDPRKKLSFTEDGRFGRSNFVVEDDVKNVVRGVDFGFSTIVQGGLQQNDINPGETVTHVCVFTEPLPKTEFLTLTVDFSCFYEEGEVVFKIPMNSVQRER
jgi:hypothetical protein